MHLLQRNTQFLPVSYHILAHYRKLFFKLLKIPEFVVYTYRFILQQSAAIMRLKRKPRHLLIIWAYVLRVSKISEKFHS